MGSDSQPVKMAQYLVLAFCLVGLVVCIPPVFDDYFDEDVKIVDVSQDSAIKACVTPSTPLVNKISRATKTCLGDDETYNWEDFSKLNEGQDPDKNGLTVKLENAEACFYGEMGWLVGGQVKKEVIIADFGNLGSNVKGGFVTDINQCSAWDGRISGRTKRSAEGIEDGAEVEDVEKVETGGLLGWVKSLVRSKRQAPGPRKVIPRQVKKTPVKKQPVKKQPVKKQPVAGKKAPIKTAQGARGSILKKKQPIKKKKKIIRKKIPRKGPLPKKTAPAGATRTININTYNKLWCFDLAVGQALKKCVEEKIKA